MNMVPSSSMAVMALCAVIGIVAPIILAWWLVKKYKVKISTILIGAGVFVVFALILESIMHQIILKGPHGAAIMGNIWYYALYGGLAAGIFEETGRFIAMKWLLKQEPSSAVTGVAYGAGHGGIEMILIFGLSMISNIALSAMINSGQADTLLATSPASAVAQVQAQLDQLQTTAAGSYLIGIWERVSAIVLQLSMSVLVWAAVRKGGKYLWLFPAAIFIHFLVDAGAVVLSKSTTMVATEIIIMAEAIATAAIAYMIGKQLKEPVTE